MTEIVLFHHVQGLTDGVRSFADQLRQAGHTVHTPDLFDGQTFATLEEGMAFARETGFGALGERGVAAGERSPRRRLRGHLLRSDGRPATRADAPGRRRRTASSPPCLPVSEFGDAWPAGSPSRCTARRATSSSTRTSRLRARSSHRPTTPSSSSTPARSISSPTRHSRRTTPMRPRLLVERVLSFLERLMTYTIKALDESTWDAFAALVEANNGVFGGCWCIGFHAEGPDRNDGAINRQRKLERVKQGTTHAALVFDGDDCLGWCQFGAAGRVAADQEPRAVRERPAGSGRLADRVQLRRQGTPPQGRRDRRPRGCARPDRGARRRDGRGLPGRRRLGARRLPLQRRASTYERLGFVRDRKIGKHRWVVTKVVEAARR